MTLELKVSMNIVIVNHYAGSPTLGMEYRPYYLGKEWIKSGHNVMIIGGSFSHLRSKQPEISTAQGNEVIDGITYRWLKVNNYKGNSIGRIFSMFLFTWRLYFGLGSILRTYKPDLIIASSTYPLDNFPAYFHAKQNKALYCYEVHDLWPLSPMELGGYSKYHPFIILMQLAENFAYKRADFVVSMLPKTLDHMIQHGLRKEKFVYIPNGIALNDWQYYPAPKSHTMLLDHLHAQNKIVIGYAGGHSISNALNNLIDAAAQAMTDCPNMAFVLVGAGSEKEKLIIQAKNLGLTNTFFLPSVKKSEIPALLSYMDILYLGWHNNPLYKFGISPNKLFDYMMAAKPIIHAVNAGNDLVQESGCGISVQPEDPKAIVEACLKISFMTKKEKDEMGRRGNVYVSQNNSYEILAQKFADFARQRIEHAAVN